MIDRTAFQATLDVTVEPIEGSDDWQIKLFEEPNIVATDWQLRELGIVPPQLHTIVVYLTEKELVDVFLEDERNYKLENARKAYLEGRGVAVLDINAVGGPKHMKEAMCVAQTAVSSFYDKDYGYGSQYADVFQKIADVCDEHRPIGSDGKHGTRRCTYTCGCDKN